MKKRNFLLIMIILLSFLLASCQREHTHVFINGICECGEKEEVKYTITFKDYDGRVIETISISKGDYINYPKDPIRDGYMFIGWDNNLENINSDLVVNALYEKEELKYTITFKDYNGDIIEVISISEGAEVTYPENPVREGYDFIGWDNNLENINSDLVVNALYKEQIIVGENRKYKTLAEAIEVSNDGDIIYLDEGQYKGAIISKSIEIRGKNFNIDSKSIRNEETTFTSDIIINASNVIINGVQLIDKAKFTFDNLKSDVENIKFLYCKISNSTLNANNERNVAPFNFVSNNNYFIKDIVLDNCYIEQVESGRPMVMYIVDVEGLRVENSYFYGGVGKGTYNDAIKIDDKDNGNASFGIKGNVIIRNNKFKNYSQYAIWFRQYGSGNYLIENNYFDNVGQTIDKHAVINFNKSIECDKIEINVLSNRIERSCFLFRIDELECNNAICNVNNNSMIAPSGTYYIINSTKDLQVNAESNYYGTSTIDASKFSGNINYDNYIKSYYEMPGNEDLELRYDSSPYVEVDETIKINYVTYGFDDSIIKWTSSDENIAFVNEAGDITGISKGTAIIKAIVEEYDIEKCIVVEVYDNIDEMEEVVKFVLSTMNSYSYASTAANSRTNYGLTNPYFYSIYRGASTYLFEDLEIDTESYARDGKELLANNKVEYITIHDTWALQRTAQGIAEYFLTDETSIHYAVGNDGLYQIIRLTDKAAHAGDSPYRAYALEKTNVKATNEKAVITMIDGYFAINGIKTNLRPYTDYEGTIQDTNNYTSEQITYSGIRCLIGDDGYYYLGKTYFNETYQTISNFGGNANSIGIEMESQRGTDFYLNMQRTAKLVAMLMDKFGLSTNDVKMHNYFSGKNCAQLLKNNLKDRYDYQIDKHNIEDTLWDEFLDLCDVELQMLEYSKDYKFELISKNTALLSNTGRIINHNTSSECVEYTIRITNINTNKVVEINSSIIIPGSINIDPCYMNK